jgi:hypothetical protein
MVQYPLTPRRGPPILNPEQRRRFGLPSRGGPPADNNASTAQEEEQDPADAVFHPTIADVAVVRRIFNTPRAFLPTELVDEILDYAEYWPHSSTHVNFVAERGTPLGCSGDTQNQDALVVCLGEAVVRL